MRSPPFARLMRVSAIAAAWFMALTFLNIVAEGRMRGTVLYALPVAFVSWHGVRLGIVFAVVGALSAWAGGAIPQPGALEPVWIEGLWAFLKLCAVAVGTQISVRYLGKRRAS